MTLTGLSARKARVKMSAKFEYDEDASPRSSGREKRQENLAAVHAREKSCLEYLEKTAAFFEESMSNFRGETSGAPILDVMISSPESRLEIRLRVDSRGRILEVTDENPF
jgi:hypothetical protein